MAKRSEKHADVAVATDDLRDFTLGAAFGLIKHHAAGAAGEGYYLEDPDRARAASSATAVARRCQPARSRCACGPPRKSPGAAMTRAP